MKKQGVCGMDAATQRPHIVVGQWEDYLSPLATEAIGSQLPIVVASRLRPWEAPDGRCGFQASKPAIRADLPLEKRSRLFSGAPGQG